MPVVVGRAGEGGVKATGARKVWTDRWPGYSQVAAQKGIVAPWFVQGLTIASLLTNAIGQRCRGVKSGDISTRVQN